MNSDKVLIRDLLKTIFRYKFSIVAIMLLTVAFSIQLTNLIEKKYKASFEFNVYSKYFKNPLISEIIPGVFNIPEMRFTIDSMVKEAINDDFIDEIGEEYGIYQEGLSDREFAKQRQFLRHRFSYYSTGGQSYKVSFTYSDALVAKEVAEKTLEVVKANFIDSRIATIELVKTIMVKRLKSFNASQKMAAKGSDKALASKSYDVLRSELTEVNNNIAALSKHFNISHPKIVKLMARKKTVLRWLEEFNEFETSDEEGEPSIAMTTDKTVSENLTSKFYSKYHDFNIALDIEKRSLESYIGVLQRPQLPVHPMWPKKRLFASVGLILGFVFAFIYVFIREVTMPNQSEKLTIEARKLGTTVIGTFPAVQAVKVERELGNTGKVKTNNNDYILASVIKRTEAQTKRPDGVQIH